MNQPLTPEEKFINKINELKEIKAKGKKIGVAGYCDLAKVIDFDNLSEVFTQTQIQSITPAEVVVRSNQNKFKIDKYVFFWLGEFTVIGSDINDQNHLNKVKRISAELQKIGKLAA